MYKGSSNTSVVKENFSCTGDFEDYINDPFRKVVEILHYNEIEAYGDNQFQYLLQIKVTMIIDNTIY